MRSFRGSATRSAEARSDLGDVDVAPEAVASSPSAPHRLRVWLTFVVVIVVATAVRVPGLDRVFGGRKAFRQSQTAFAIREYARHGIDLLNPPLPIFGPPWRVWLEFPLPQAIASLFVHLGLTAAVAGRLMGLLSLQVTALLLFLLVRRWGGARAALIAVVLVETVPMAAWFGTASLIEFPTTSLALATVLALQRWFDAGRWWWLVAAAVASSLTFIVKVTTASAWVAPLLALAVVAALPDWRARWRRSLLGLLAAPGVGVIAEAWWVHYSNVHNAANPFSRFLTSSHERRGLVGTVHDRLSLSKNGVLVHRMGELMAGHALLFLAAAVLIAVATRHRLLLLSLVAVPVLGAELWFPLYVQHDYYPAATLPAVAAVMAVGIDVVATWVGRRLPDSRRALRPAATAGTAVAMIGAVLLLAWSSSFGEQVRNYLAGKHPVPW
jgi:4-amino-4-deoxy-L-arabinose transferase-like glycosyltransferase